MKTLSIVCPVNDEQDVIHEFHEKLSETRQALSPRFAIDVIYVADGCLDGTLEVLKQIAARDPAVKILVLSSRFGHQMALLAGIDQSSADIVVMLDADLQHPPDVIPELVAKHEEGYDIVYTIRVPAASTGLFKRLSSLLFYKVAKRLSEVPITENGADFRLISKRVARVFQTQIRERNQFLRGLFGWVGFKSTGIRYHERSRSAGRSKYTLGRMLRLAVIGIVSFSKRPLQAATFVGLCLVGLGLASMLLVLADYFFGARVAPLGWVLLAILLLFLSGVQLVFMGIFGEYLGCIFDEVKGRPHYIIEEKINFSI